jgi:hypothetical protein
MNEAYDSDFSTESAKLGQELMDGRIKANSKAKYKKSYIQFVNYARDHFPDIMHNNESVILEHIRSSHLKDFFGHIIWIQTKSGKTETARSDESDRRKSPNNLRRLQNNCAKGSVGSIRLRVEYFCMGILAHIMEYHGAM